MDNFHPYQVQDFELERRSSFPDDAVGVKIWNDLVEWLRTVNEDIPAEEIELHLNKLRNFPKPSLESVCPRVFISHKQIDEAEALRIANLASNEGFYYWLDVLDPNLAAPNVATPPVRLAIATAMIIEMALLNCSHVLAVMTKHTKQSAWVPYEYGRVKDRSITSTQCSAWVKSTVGREFSGVFVFGRRGIPTKVISIIGSGANYPNGPRPKRGVRLRNGFIHLQRHCCEFATNQMATFEPCCLRPPSE